MIYMCGADLESSSESGGYLNSGVAGYASMDIDELLEPSGQPDNVNIIIETGGAAKWARSDVQSVNKSGKLGRWEVRNQKLVKKDPVSKANMGLTSTLQSFLEWGFENYPAENYGLIMWNHGGAMDGCCFDENYSNDSITADELNAAVTNARSKKGITEKLDWITYDACLMAVQDVAQVNSKNFNYMLCSQESEAGYGYDYDAWLPTLYANPYVSGADLLPVIGHTFMVEEKELFQYWGEPFDQTQSVIDLSYMDDYKTAFDAFSTQLSNVITSSSKWNTFKNLVNKAQKYGYYDDDEYSSYNGGYVYDIFDLKQALTKVKGDTTNFSSCSSEIDEVLSILDSMVIYEEHGNATTGCGLCLFCPISGLSAKSSYSAQTNFKTMYNIYAKYGKWYSGY